MLAFITNARRAVRLRQLRKRFPLAVLHKTAAIDNESKIAPYVTLFHGVSLIGSRVGPYTYIQANSGVFEADIGAFCSIAGWVTIGLASHPTTMVSTSPVFYDNSQPLPRFFTRVRRVGTLLPRTVVGADVWIGQSAMLKAGITVGVGAVIGAGAIVTKDVEPYAIVGGNPARLIRYRFETEIRRDLLASKWWERTPQELERLTPLFESPVEFLAAFGQSKS